jgi:hypothetical protein
VDREVEQFVEAAVADMVELCPWMVEEDVGLWRLAITLQFRLVLGEVIDLARMMRAILGLAQRAEAVGDARRTWAFNQWYAWVCASMRGEEYRWPELPEALEVSL